MPRSRADKTTVPGATLIPRPASGIPPTPSGNFHLMILAQETDRFRFPHTYFPHTYFPQNFRHTGIKDGSRIFVALFDYDPPTMSPNPEACDDELAFSEGQLIKVG